MLSTELLERLRPIAAEHPLLPIGWGDHKKAPMLYKWQKHLGYSIEELKNHPDAIAVGVRCDQILCLDYDGKTALLKLKHLGLSPSEIGGWNIGRTTSPYSQKVLFVPTKEQVALLPYNHRGTKEFQFKIPSSEVVNEQLEFFFDHGRQVIVMGQHYSSGGEYQWDSKQGPEQLGPPSDEVWETVVEQLFKYQKRGPSKAFASSPGEDWNRLESCPVCGRNEHQVCQIHVDGETLRCFIGNSYKPPEWLNPGDVVSGEWAYCRDQSVDWGEFSIFVRHKPTPLQKIRRWHRG